MRTLATAALIAVIASSSIVLGRQDPASENAGNRLRPAPHPWSDLEQPVQDPAFDAEAWRIAITLDDLDQREVNFEDLVALARRNPEARAALRKWTEDQVDPELAWTARMALREVQSRSRPFGADWPGRGFPSGFDFGLPGFGPGVPFADEQWFGNLESDLEELLRQPGMLGPQGLPRMQNDRSKRFQIQTGPDGVKVEVWENEGGEESRKTYEADSMEALLEAHPELRPALQPMPGATWDTHNDLQQLLDQLRARPAWPQAPFAGPPTAKIPTDRLGVMVLEPERWSADELGLSGIEPGVGLLVEQVLPGSIAHAAGVRPGEVIVSLDGEPLRSAQQVATLLAEREDGEAIQLTVVDGSGSRRELEWQPPVDRSRQV